MVYIRGPITGSECLNWEKKGKAKRAFLTLIVPPGANGAAKTAGPVLKPLIIGLKRKSEHF